ncbi:GEVED domain-containing protein [Ferruginibacter sp. SUN106]|uniref:GEVED domain-containing protein n=1 Tax=Ferruginibacter sp. SUN106 TaxID=2978348 RepID=UPI003D36B7CE
MKTLYTKAFLIFVFTTIIYFSATAQYCSPVINNSGIYILQLNFGGFGDIAGGQTYFTASNGYTQTLGSSAGTVKPYFGGGFFYSISNPTGSSKNYDFRGFADWNDDGDFADAGEQLFTVSGTVPAISSTTTGNSIIPPLSAVPGDHRIRITLSQSGTATACGTYTGEVEDYKITIPINTAPVLNTGATTYVNTLLSSVTNSDGIAIAELVNGAKPAATLISDANDRGPEWYNMVPRGIAIYGQSAPNGTWQYKVGAGSWTNFGAVSSSNALQLMADPSYTTYQTATRIRFTPTSTGTPSFTYRAWDGTTGSNGSYANIVSTGGTTAFSTANLTTTLPVIASTGYNDNIYLSTLNNIIYTAPLNKTTFTLGNAEPLLSNAPDYYAANITLDANTNRLFWISGQNADKIASANTNGTGQQLSLISGITYLTGLATGNGKLFYWNWASDYSSADLYRANTDGTGILKISGGAGQFNGTGTSDTKDIEYYNNKIYFQYSDGTNFKIASANTDGTGFTDLYSTTNYFGGMTVAAGNIYWTETDATVNKMAISGGAVTVLSIETGTTLNDIITDGAGTTVYFLETDATNPTYSMIRKVPAAGGSTTTELTISGVATSISFNTSAVVLAVSLLDFTGEYDNNKHASLLKWKTSGETNFAYFTLERSVDAINFIPVTNVTASGSTSQGGVYNFTDIVKDITTDKLYYRLKEVDQDGHYKYSATVLLRIAADITVSRLYPNPGNGVYTIQLNEVPAAMVSLKVYNKIGQLVTIGEFNTKKYQLNLGGQASGIYYLQLTYTDGTSKQFTVVKE